MITTVHAAAGASLGCLIKPRKFKKWLLLITASLISHVILDSIPHWDYPYQYSWILADLALTVAIIWLIIYLSQIRFPVIVGAAFGAAPDLEHVLVHHGWMEEQVFISHLPWFPHGELDLPWGLVVQFIFVVLCLWVCFRLRNSTGSFKASWSVRGQPDTKKRLFYLPFSKLIALLKPSISSGS